MRNKFIDYSCRQANNLVWHLLQGLPVDQYAKLLCALSTELVGSVQFVFVLWKLGKISHLLDDIHELMEMDSKASFMRKQKTIINCLMIAAGSHFTLVCLRHLHMLFIGRLGEVYRFFFDTSFLPVKIVSVFVGLLSDLTNILLCFGIVTFYYSVCVQVACLYQQLGWEIRKLNDETEDHRKTIKNSVDLHVNIMQVTQNIQNCFSGVLLCNILCLATFMGVLVYNISRGSLPMMNVVFLPTLLCLLFVICRGSFFIAHESEVIARRMYDELRWYDFGSKDIGRSMQIILQQLQNPREIRLLRLQRVNLEYFLDVS